MLLSRQSARTPVLWITVKSMDGLPNPPGRPLGDCVLAAAFKTDAAISLGTAEALAEAALKWGFRRTD
jgi:hypothetical protein